MASRLAKSCVRFAIVVILLLCAASLAFAVDWQAINPAELQITSLPEQPGAPAFVLYHEEIDNDQQHYHSLYMRIKVLTEAGRKYADIRIPYYREGFNISDIHGRTIHVDGSIVEFKGKPFDKDYVKSKTVKIKMKSFSLPDVQVGSILEYKYTIRYDSDRAMAPEWELQNELFQRNEHFAFTSLTGAVRIQHGQISRGLSWVSVLPKGSTVKDVRDRYELDASNVLPYVNEEYMPPAAAFKYHVNFYYVSVASSAEYWTTEGNYWSSDVERFIGKKGGVAEAVTRVLAPGDSAEQKVKKIYAYVSTLENLSYQSQRTQQEQRAIGQRENRGAEDVLRQQLGDRSDITRLFVAMVRAAGIAAWVMEVTDRSETLFDAKFLSTGQLSAEIAIVRPGEKDVFLDPGTRYCPYGLLNWKYSGTMGIRQTASGATSIVSTPMPEYTGALRKRIARLRMDEHGQVEGTMAAGFFGQEALQHRLEGLQTDDVGRTKILEDEAKSWFPSNAEISVTKGPDWNATEAPLVVEYKVSCPLLISAGRRLLTPSNVLAYNRPAMFPHNERVQPVYLEYPNREVDEVRLTLPDTFQVEDLPASVSEKIEYALYQADRSQDKNVITTKRDLAIANFALGASQYKSIKGFYDKVKEYDDQQILLKRAPNAAH